MDKRTLKKKDTKTKEKKESGRKTTMSNKEKKAKAKRFGIFGILRNHI